MRRICVFCGSNNGVDPAYTDAAREFGQALAQRGLGLVYGGAGVGLMGALADAVLAGGGEVCGVITQGLVEKEVAHQGLTDLCVVESMHERKATMAALADAFVALPGGLGTLDEFFEALTWGQLGIHAKPCGLLNIRGYYDELVRFLDRGAAQGFIPPKHRTMILVADQIPDIFNKLCAYVPPQGDKWLATP